MASLRVLALLALAWVGVAAAQEAPRTDQEVLADRVVDHGWGFELVAEGKEWQRLGEAEARRLQPEAVAGVMHVPTGVPVFAIVSPRHGRSAADAVRARVEASRFDDTQVVRQGPTTLAGRPAEMFELTGRYETYRMRFSGVALERGEHLYELISWGTVQQTGRGSGYARWDVLRLSEGDAVPGRGPSASSVPDSRGLGWRVRGGLFESTVCGVRVRVTGAGMRLATGSVARASVAGAEAVLADDARQVIVGLTPARPPGSTADEVTTIMRGLLMQTFGSPPELEPFSVAAPEADGGSVAFSRFEVPGQAGALELAHGVLSADGRPRVQLLAYWPKGSLAQGTDCLRRALANLEVLDPAPLEALERELAQLPDPESAVTATIAYRRGVLRAFGPDLTFARPTGGLWRATLDAQSLSNFGGAGLVMFEEPRLGLTAWVTVHQQDGYTDEAFHAWVVSSYGGRVVAAPRKHRAKNGDLRVSWLEVAGEGDLATRVLVATAIKGRRLVTVGVSGTARDLEANRAAALSVLDGLTLLDYDLRDFEQEATYLRDERLGFRLDSPADGWTLAVGEQQANLGSHVRVVKAQDGAGHRVEVFAVSASLDAIDPTAYEAYLLRMALHSINEAFDGLAPTELEKSTIAGTPCRHLRLKTEQGKIDLFLLHREGVSLAFGAFDPDGEGPPLDELKRCLQLLD